MVLHPILLAILQQKKTRGLLTNLIPASARLYRAGTLYRKTIYRFQILAFSQAGEGPLSRIIEQATGALGQPAALDRGGSLAATTTVEAVLVARGGQSYAGNTESFSDVDVDVEGYCCR